jgi:hypothetical protein
MDAIDPTPSPNDATSDARSHDEPYRFGRRPTARAPFPFTERQFARLLIVRGRVQAAPSSWDEVEAA